MDEIEREMFAFFIVLSQFTMVLTLPFIWAAKGLQIAIGVYLVFTSIVVGIPFFVRVIECVVFPSVVITVKLLEFLDNE